jgi:hypothetical protein
MNASATEMEFDGRTGARGINGAWRQRRVRPTSMLLARASALALAGLFALHGLAHAAGLRDIWGMGGVAAANTSTLLSGLDAGSAAYAALGVAWVAALLLFVLAAVGVLARRAWWAATAFAATGLSLALCLVWLEAAWVGVVLNAVILAGLVGRAIARRLRSRRVT